MSVKAQAIKFAIFAVITLFLSGLMIQTIGQFNFQSKQEYKALFTDATAVFSGQDVRIAGVKVGLIKKVQVKENKFAEITFDVKSDIKLPTTTRAELRYQDIVGGRYLALVEGPGGQGFLKADQVIPLSQTKPALDLNVLLNGFRPLFQALNPTDVNRLAFEIIQTFQGEGSTVQELLVRTASLTNTLADKDQLIGDVINNLNSVLTTVSSRDRELDQLIVQLNRLMGGLAQDRQVIGDSLTNIDLISGDLSALITDIRAPLTNDLQHLASVTGQLADQKGELAQKVQQLPRTLNAADRTATFGSWFNFYLCKADGSVNFGGTPLTSPISLNSTNPVCTN